LEKKKTKPKKEESRERIGEQSITSGRGEKGTLREGRTGMQSQKETKNQKTKEEVGG